MSSETVQIVVVGAGNVGLPAVLTLGLTQQAQGAPWQVWVVDFDRVEEKDAARGYHRSLVGRFKAEAAVEMVRLLHGEETARRFRPVPAAAQSVPGLLRKADAVFNGTDAALDAAWVSEEARGAWEVRLSTGIFGKTAVHTVEVLPEGYTLGDLSYDSAAWADTARRQCTFGIPENVHAGIPQPFGTLTAALAVQLFLARSGYTLIRVSGAEIVQWAGSPHLPPTLRESHEIRLSYEAGLARLWVEVAARLAVAPEDIRLAFPIPFVSRRCTKHGAYRGFERYPVRGSCPACGDKTYCLAAPRELGLEDVADSSEKSLRLLNAPAGLRLTAWTRRGGRGEFHLPFRLEDVPELPDFEHAPERIDRAVAAEREVHL